KGRGLAIQWVEVERRSDWPSAPYEEMLGKVDLKKVPPTLVVPIARRALRVLATRAYRRPVKDAEIKPYVELVRSSYKPANFENALRTGMQALLCSPDFLLLAEETGKLSDHALACRLPYFLWKSPPDAELRSVAERGELSRPEILHEQVERMLAAPKAAAF